tara:strand:+ start:1573 stop:2148 length:576 start_codon:yes stop_codon:yes gene_type:complete
VFTLVGRDPLIDVAVALEAAARKDPYFVQRKLYPNVDFYSGLVYRALGFPPEFFTVLFAVPRAAGYLAHWRESLTDTDTKIMRPQQIYQGVWLRDYPELQTRDPCAGEDRMWNVAPSNASRRRLAGDTFDTPAMGNYPGSTSAEREGFRGLAVSAKDAGVTHHATHLSSPAFSGGVVAGDATSGVDALLRK